MDLAPLGTHVRQTRARTGALKALLYCDNADPHMDPVVLGEFRENKITLAGLNAGGTGIKQPLDCRYFGNVGPIMTRLVAEDHAVLTEHNIGHYYERASEVWRKSRADAGIKAVRGSKKKKAAKKVAPVHNHDLCIEVQKDCPLCQSHGNIFHLTEVEYELVT